MSRHRYLPLLFAALLACLTAHAGCAKPLTVAFGEFTPDMYIAEQGNYAGVVIDYLSEVGKKTGCKFTYINVPWARAWYFFKNGQMDIVPIAAQNSARDGFGDYVSNEISEQVSIVSLRQLDIDSAAQLIRQPIKFDVMRGAEYGPKYSEFIGNPALRGRFEVSPDPITMVRKLKGQRMDAILTLPSGLLDAAKAEGVEAQLNARCLQDLDKVGTGMYLSHEIPAAEAAQLKAAMRELNQSGFYYKRFMAAVTNYPPWTKQGISK